MIVAALPAVAQAGPQTAPDIIVIASQGTSAQVREALKAGMDAEARSGHGITPLMRAAAGDSDPAVIGILVEFGAQVNEADDSGHTPLMFAARGGDRRSHGRREDCPNAGRAVQHELPRGQCAPGGGNERVPGDFGRPPRAARIKPEISAEFFS